MGDRWDALYRVKKPCDKAIEVEILLTKPLMSKGGTGGVTATAGGNLKMGSSALAGADTVSPVAGSY